MPRVARLQLRRDFSSYRLFWCHQVESKGRAEETRFYSVDFPAQEAAPHAAPIESLAPHRAGRGCCIDTLCSSPWSPSSSLVAEHKQEVVPTYKKEIKGGEVRMTAGQMREAQKPQATNLSSESRSPESKHRFCRLSQGAVRLARQPRCRRPHVLGRSPGPRVCTVELVNFGCQRHVCLPNLIGSFQIWRFPRIYRRRTPRLLHAD